MDQKFSGEKDLEVDIEAGRPDVVQESTSDIVPGNGVWSGRGSFSVSEEVGDDMIYPLMGDKNPAETSSQSLDLSEKKCDEDDQFCGISSKQDCLELPPVKYRVLLRWPMGKDVIWFHNVKITAEEVLSSGSINKRMMMMEDDHISFRSASPMFDEVEDYSRQIAQMIGIRNDNFIEASVRTILDIGCGYGSFGAHLLSKQLLTMYIANLRSFG